MKSLQKYLFLAGAVLVLGFLLLPATAKAAYQSNDLIDDYIFINPNTMSAASIQTFLSGKGGGISNYSEGGKSAAEIIYEASQTYGLNPQVVLSTMQKEQTLVTDPTPPSSNMAAIDCAMGYYSCGNPSYNTFTTQVDGGAWQLRFNYARASGDNNFYNPSIPYACKDGHDTNPNNNLYSTGLFPGRTVTFYDPGGSARTITLANAATASLYCYTPYVGPKSETGYSGSYNFVVSFEAWFGPSTGEGYTLDIANNGDPRQFILMKGKRYWVSQDVKTAFGLPATPTIMDSNYLGTFPDGPPLTRLMRPTGTLDVYFVDGGKCYKVTSPNMLSAWNFDPAAIIDVSVGLGLVPTNSGNLTYSIRSASSSDVFLVDGGVKRRYANANVQAAWEGGGLAHTVISDAYLQAMGPAIDITLTKAIYGGHYFLMNQGRAFLSVDPNIAGAWGIGINALQLNRDISPEFAPYNTLTRFTGSSLTGDTRLFVVDNGALYYLSPDQATNLGLTAGTPRMAIDPAVTTQPISPWSWVMVQDASGKQYVIDGGTKRAFNSDGQVLNSWTANGSIPTPQVTNGFLNLLPNNVNIERGIKGSGPPVYLVLGLTKHHILSPATAALYAPIMQVSDSLINILPPGSDIN